MCIQVESHVCDVCPGVVSSPASSIAAPSIGSAPGLKTHSSAWQQSSWHMRTWAPMKCATAWLRCVCRYYAHTTGKNIEMQPMQQEPDTVWQRYQGTKHKGAQPSSMPFQEAVTKQAAATSHATAQQLSVAFPATCLSFPTAAANTFSDRYGAGFTLTCKLVHCAEHRLPGWYITLVYLALV
jgi:hypothetical protein